MDSTQHQLNVTISALQGAAVGIAAAMEEESITSEQVHDLLSVLASRMQRINNQTTVRFERRAANS